jgi:hypothetical protein
MGEKLQTLFLEGQTLHFQKVSRLEIESIICILWLTYHEMLIWCLHSRRKLLLSLLDGLWFIFRRIFSNHTMQRRWYVDKWMVMNEKGFGRRRWRPNLRYYDCIRLKRLRKTMKNINQHSRSPVLSFEPGSSRIRSRLILCSKELIYLFASLCITLH